MDQGTSIWNSLEIVKLIVGIITPIVVILLGVLVTRFAKRVEALQWARRTIIEKRIQVYDEVAPQLNDLLCFFTLVGSWKDLSPPEILSLKRYLDRKVQISLPFFSHDLKISYNKFMTSCYKTYGLFGHDALLKGSISAHRKVAGEKWDEEWDALFVSEMSGIEGAAQREATKRSYDELINTFAKELGIELEQPKLQGRFSKNIGHST